MSETIVIDKTSADALAASYVKDVKGQLWCVFAGVAFLVIEDKEANAAIAAMQSDKDIAAKAQVALG